MIKKILLLSLLTLLLSACGEPPPYTNIANKDIKSLQAQGIALYDVRRKEEWRETGVIAGSRLLTFTDESGRVKPNFLETLTREVDKNQPVMLICRTGNRTNVLARHLVDQMGYTQVYNVQHGIAHWIRKDLPVSRP